MGIATQHAAAAAGGVPEQHGLVWNERVEILERLFVLYRSKMVPSPRRLVKGLQDLGTALPSRCNPTAAQEQHIPRMRRVVLQKEGYHFRVSVYNCRQQEIVTGAGHGCNTMKNDSPRSVPNSQHDSMLRLPQHVSRYVNIDNANPPNMT